MTRMYAALLGVFLCAAADSYAAGGGAPPASTGPATEADVILLVVYVLLALVFSFLCSVAEAVL